MKTIPNVVVMGDFNFGDKDGESHFVSCLITCTDLIYIDQRRVQRFVERSVQRGRRRQEIRTWLDFRQEHGVTFYYLQMIYSDDYRII